LSEVQGFPLFFCGVLSWNEGWNSKYFLSEVQGFPLFSLRGLLAECRLELNVLLV